MSDTPRTEAEVKFGLSDPLAGAVTVCADFACRLERELNAAQATIRQQQLLDEEIMRLRDHVKRLEEAVKFGDDFIATLQVGEEDMEQRDWIRAVADARIAYVSAKRSAKEAKP